MPRLCSFYRKHIKPVSSPKLQVDCRWGKVLLALASDQIAPSPPAQQLRTWFSAAWLWCWVNLVSRSDRWLSCRLNGFKSRFSTAMTGFAQTTVAEWFHSLFIAVGLDKRLIQLKQTCPTVSTLLFQGDRLQQKVWALLRREGQTDF